MKKQILSICLAMWGMAVFAQFTPNTRWPYINEHFQEGTIYFNGNQKSTAQLNIHLWGNVLHYVSQDGKIYQSADKNVIRVEIAGTPYLYADGKLMQLVGEKNKNVVLKLVKGDFDAMNEGTGAYGASLNSSAKMDLTSLDLGGMDKPSLAKMQSEKNEGREIPIVTQYHFIINGQLLEANKSEMTKYVGNTRKEEWKTFLKTNKIKWKKEDCLLKILDFFTQN